MLLRILFDEASIRKLSLPINKAITCLIVVLLMIISLGVAFGWDYYPASYNWSFQNYSYLGFNQAINFTEAPYQGMPSAIGLVGYWNMNEGLGTLVQDLSGNGNNGTINGATWVAGKFGDALSFNGSLADYVKVNNSLSLQVTGDLTLSCWVYFNTLATKQTLIFKSWSGEYELSMDGANGKIEFDHAGMSVFSSSSSVHSGVWQNIVAVRSISAMTVTFYINGIQVGAPQAFITFPKASFNIIYIGQEKGYNPLNGTIDNVRIYNRTLNAREISTLYAIGQNPDSVSFFNYYNYQEPVTKNTMLIHVDNPNGNSNNTALVTCTNFFEDNRLVFQANNSATVNVWTNLGQPVFSTGVWNNNNFTTTLTLDAFSTAVLNWNPATPPLVSNISTASTTIGSTATFSVLWSDNQSLSGGGYIFSTNNTGRWVNASWTPFNSNPNWSNASLTLTSKDGAIVGFIEYANNSLNLWGNSGIDAITTKAPSSTPTATSKATPTPIPSTTPTASPALTSTSTPTPTLTPTPTPTQTNSFPTKTILIAASAIIALVSVFVLAFKKGYVTIEVINEENPQEASDDYTI